MNYHVYFYLLGWFYYSLSPIFLVYFGIFPELTEKLTISTWYLVYSFNLMITFLLGSFLGSHIRIGNISLFTRMVNNNKLNFALLLIFFLIIWTYIPNIQIGYGNDESTQLGILSTVIF